jgi:Spy/CpxP family protein refolding chaperone
MKTFAALILTAILAAALFAAPQSGPRSQIQNMVDKLNVTPDQKAKLDPILDVDAKQVRALRGDSALSDEDRQKKTAAIRADTDTKIKPILTADQWTKLQELRAERKAQGKGGAKKKK